MSSLHILDSTALWRCLWLFYTTCVQRTLLGLSQSGGFERPWHGAPLAMLNLIPWIEQLAQETRRSLQKAPHALTLGCLLLGCCDSVSSMEVPK